MPTRVAPGASSFSSSSRLAMISGPNVVAPVTLVPGRATLFTMPIATGSLLVAGITMGIVVVALLAATSALMPNATSTSTLSATSSAASSGRRS